ncbi:MAG: VRR-NUC domain-containing protein [Candidatus Amulumruptor caecigallinarius]|nr:VRR-NUC domain-containing protein [Candidatus Amulumruptor caecigallinarius]MCM1397432.1 VRR-NUC domain-containing protein [Candidatus Amulumruptor caecigallinarius]MCM1454361.1 VRR-NUC domain-containing protein [bacterium]
MTTEKDILELEQKYTESKIQHICVSWFRQTFPHVAKLLTAVPNGGWRGARAGAQMVYEGQVKGVADLILLYPSGGKSSLCVEMKVPKRKGRSAGVQSVEQKEWQTLVETYGSTYVVCHGLIEFIKAVCSYLQVSDQRYITEALCKYPMYR